MKIPHYPTQFWIILVGILLSTIGVTMIWPFLMIYASEQLAMPLVTVASLLSINSIAGIIASIAAGPVVDRLGRKWILVIGLLGNGAVYFFFQFAHTYLFFALLMALSGLFSPLYRLGTDAMLTDLVAAEKRPDGFALLRMGRNVGVALGPLLGGLVLSTSYRIGFLCAAISLTTYGIISIFATKETLPVAARSAHSTVATQIKDYIQVLRDGQFVRLLTAFILVEICAALIWVMLSVYAKQNFNVSEQQYGWIPAANALMVVFLQVVVLRLARRFNPHHAMALGGVLYGLGLFTVGASSGFYGFLLGMVILTLGELIIMPLSSAYAANLAPEAMRGRYLSVFGLAWSVAVGVGPLMGGWAGDLWGVRAPWFIGLIIGLLSALAFLWLGLGKKPQQNLDVI